LVTLRPFKCKRVCYTIVEMYSAAFWTVLIVEQERTRNGDELDGPGDTGAHENSFAYLTGFGGAEGRMDLGRGSAGEAAAVNHDRCKG